MSGEAGTLGAKSGLAGVAKLRLSVDTYDQFVSVCHAVAVDFGISQHDLFQKKRYINLVTARRVVWWLLRFAGWSFPRIARRFEMNHSSIIVGVKIIEHEIQCAGSIYAGFLPAAGQ